MTWYPYFIEFIAFGVSKKQLEILAKVFGCLMYKYGTGDDELAKEMMGNIIQAIDPENTIISYGVSCYYDCDRNAKLISKNFMVSNNLVDGYEQDEEGDWNDKLEPGDLWILGSFHIEGECDTVYTNFVPDNETPDSEIEMIFKSFASMPNNGIGYTHNFGATDEGVAFEYSNKRFGEDREDDESEKEEDDCIDGDAPYEPITIKVFDKNTMKPEFY